MPQPMELWSPTSSAASDAPSLPPPRGSRAAAYEPTSDQDGTFIRAITRMAAFETKSFEELRLEDTEAQYLFRPPQVEGQRPTTLLERDVLRALGDVVLNERHWWKSRHDHAVWKSKKREIAVRVTRATLKDAVAHVVNWMAPAAREIAETVKVEELKLSLLLAHWPTTRDAACLRDPTPFPAFGSQQTLAIGECDRYLVLAWVLFRGICKRDDEPWPVGWGVASCACSELQSLVDAIAERGVQTLERLISLREGGLDVLPEDVEALLVEEDANATEWLVETVFESVAAIRSDMDVVKTWVTRHLLTIVNDLVRTRSLEEGVVAVPAPFPNAFIVDDVDVSKAEKLADGEPQIVEFEKSLQTTAESSPVDVEHALVPLLSSLFPAFEKIYAASSRTTSLFVRHDLKTPGRPELVVGDKPRSDGFVQSTTYPRRAIIDVETVSLPAGSTGVFSGAWRYNGSLPVIDSIKIDATAVICVDATNVSVPDLQMQSLSVNDEDAIESFSRELYVRSAMVSNCSDTNAGIMAVSVSPGRAVVLPRATRYRLSNSDLVDTTKPGRIVILRIALVSPKCTTPTPSIKAILHQSPEVPEWLEDLELKARDKSISVEEARLAHYKYDRKLGSLDGEEKGKSLSFLDSVPSLTALSPERLATHYVEKHVLQKITTLTNAPQWWETQWVEGSESRREWERELESFYLHMHLQSEVAKGYTSMVASLSSQATTTADAKIENEAKSDDNDARENVFAQVAKMFSRIVMLREVHSGLMTRGGSSLGNNSAQVVVDLVQRCREAGNLEAQAQILQEFIGVGYPVDTILGPLAGIWEEINEEVKKWMKRVINEVEGRRLALLQEEIPGMYSPIEGTCVLDGGVPQVVKADLVAALEPLLCDVLSKAPDGVTTLQLVDPKCSVDVLRQVVPTFSVPRAGSIDSRLAATILQNDAVSVNGLLGRVNQRIPSDVAIDLDGKARFLTYISNVFPRAHRGLYESIDAITTAFVPLFEKLLADQLNPVRGPIFWNQDGNPVDHEVAAVENQPKTPGTFSLRGRVVQIAVEIEQIDLNADKPRCPGDHWYYHTTRQQQDQSIHDIIATGMWFAVVENVSLPRIMYPEQYFVDGYADRCLVFSQKTRSHQVQPCELIDASRSGTVLVVKLHLVDPQRAVVSTANMRPSQREWVVDYTLGEVSRFFQLPTEVHDVIESMLEWDGLSGEELSSLRTNIFNFGPQVPPISHPIEVSTPDPQAPFGAQAAAFPAPIGFSAPTTFAFGVGPTRPLGGFGVQANGGFTFGAANAAHLPNAPPQQPGQANSGATTGFPFGVAPS